MKKPIILMAALAATMTLGACAQGGVSLDGGNLFGSTLTPPASQERSTYNEQAVYPSAPAPVLKPFPRAENLIGLDEAAMIKTLGTPVFQREEPGAEIWRYAGDACTLFVYFYEDEMDILRAAYIDARAATGGDTQADGCIATVSKAYQLSAQRY